MPTARVRACGVAAQCARRRAPAATRRTTSRDLGRELFFVVDLGHVDEGAERGGVVVERVVAETAPRGSRRPRIGTSVPTRPTRGRRRRRHRRRRHRTAVPRRWAVRSSAATATTRSSPAAVEPAPAAVWACRSCSTDRRATGTGPMDARRAAVPAVDAVLLRGPDDRCRPLPSPAPLPLRGCAHPRSGAATGGQNRSRAPCQASPERYPDRWLRGARRRCLPAGPTTRCGRAPGTQPARQPRGRSGPSPRPAEWPYRGHGAPRTPA